MPSASVAVYVTVVIPNWNPNAGVSLVITGVGSTISVAVAAPRITVVSGPVASAVTASGAVSIGAVVSVIVTN